MKFAPASSAAARRPFTDAAPALLGFVVWVAAAVTGGAARAAAPPPLRVARAAVASDNAQASAAGLAALKGGGNAVDAACATALALGVVHPFASGIGGGGFALVYVAKQQKVFVLDFRERAPAAIRADLYVKDGKAVTELSREGGLAVAVPGEVRGLGELVRRFGRLPFARCVAPAEALARGQARVSWRLKEAFDKELGIQLDTPPKTAAEIAAAGRFLTTVIDPAGGARGGDEPARPLVEGAPFRRLDLARTLARLRARGPDAFYQGDLAAQIVKAVRGAGGVMSAEDLERYRAVDRAPVEFSYRGLRIFSMSPPSSGGVAMAETLGILEARYPNAADLTKLGAGSSAYLHVVAEAMKHAFADRARHLGDPDFVEVPLHRLLSPGYHAELAGRIGDGAVAARNSYGTADAPAALHRDGGTTHLSVVDAEGNAVALTTTVNLTFGARFVAGRTGVVLNDQMDDFAMQPGVPNGFGLIGSAQNAVAANKRPLSSMTPTIALADGQVRMVVGAAGGPTIITATTQVLLNVVDWKMDAQAAIAAPRIHHQWVPEVLDLERDIPRDVREALSKRGHQLKEQPRLGVVNLIVRTKAGLEVAAEPRSPSTPAGL